MGKKKPTTESLLSGFLSETPKLPEDIGLAEKEAAEILRERVLRNKGLEDYFNLRKQWSRHIIFILWTTTSFIMGMSILIGLNWLKYEQYSYLPHSIIASFFGEIVGICFVVTKYLFPSVEKK